MCREAYESPALPLSYSAADVKLTERDPERQPRSLEHITIEQHMVFWSGQDGPGGGHSLSSGTEVVVSGKGTPY
jgi:hypothetical protein